VNLPFLKFLLPSVDLAAADRVLLVQSGNPKLLTRVLDSLATQFPRCSFTVLLQRAMTDLVPVREGVEYLENQGPRPSFIRSLRERKFERVFVMYANEPGFWKLKVLPFVVGAGAIFAVNENLDWFPVDLRHTEELAAHLRWRLESSVTFAADIRSGVIEAAAKTAVYPALLAYLFGFERYRNYRIDKGGAAAGWKGENRPPETQR
jgi:hypothetical protein